MMVSWDVAFDINHSTDLFFIDIDHTTELLFIDIDHI